MAELQPSCSREDAPSYLLRRRGAFALSILVCVFLAALLRPFPASFKFRHGGDCVRYLSWGRVVSQKGLSAFPELIADYRQHWVGFPPPTRSTYLFLIALVMRLWPTPPDEYHPLVLISWLAGVFSIIPFGLFLLRLSGPVVAVLGMVLLAAAPVPRALSHFPLPDSLFLCVCLSLFWLATEWLAEKRRLLLLGLAVFSFLAVTVRETGLFGVLAAFGLFALSGKRPGRLPWAPLLALFLGSLFALIWTLFLVEGLAVLLGMARDIVRGALQTGNKAAVSGPYYRYLVDFVMVAPAATVTAIAGSGTLYRRTALRPLCATVFMTSGIIFLGMCLLPKSLRYLMPVEAGLRALCAGTIYVLWTSMRRSLALLLLAILLAHDLAIYQSLWGRDQIYDPLTFNMARQLGMIP